MCAATASGRRILWAWELGAGWGHLLPVRPLSERLLEEGCDIFAAVKDIVRAHKAFAGLPVQILQAPIALGTPQLARAPRTLPQILLNQGWGDPDTVAARLSAWEHLLDYVRPDLVVADYAPTLLLALWKRGAELPVAQFGTSFCSPPPLEVWPDLRFWLPPAPQQAGRDDARLMAAVQQALQACGAPPLDYLGRIFDRPALLTTVPEFDTYLEYRAQGTTHLNVWSSRGGQPPEWRDDGRPRVFVYLKHFRELPRLLDAIEDDKLDAILFVDGAHPTIAQRQKTHKHIRFYSQPVDVSRVVGACDLAILNGGHGLTLAMLLAGTPLLHVPLYLENALNAWSTVRLGAGLSARPEAADDILTKLQCLLNDDSYRHRAAEFAARHRATSGPKSLQATARAIRNLL